MAKLDIDDVSDYLGEMGFNPSEMMLSLYISQADSLDETLETAGYSVDTQKLIKLYLIAVLVISSGARRVNSESAPSGASHSFNYDGKALENLQKMIRQLDPQGVAEHLLQSENIGFFEVVGG